MRFLVKNHVKKKNHFRSNQYIGIERYCLFDLKSGIRGISSIFAGGKKEGSAGFEPTLS
jgi:hypothetical protein